MVTRCLAQWEEMKKKLTISSSHHCPFKSIYVTSKFIFLSAREQLQCMQYLPCRHWPSWLLWTLIFLRNRFTFQNVTSRARILAAFPPPCNWNWHSAILVFLFHKLASNAKTQVSFKLKMKSAWALMNSTVFWVRYCCSSQTLSIRPYHNNCCATWFMLAVLSQHAPYCKDL